MKILHCCLANFYADGFGYQENMITKMHKMQGHDVRILASTETMSKDRGLVYVNPSSYLTKDDIPIKRIAYVNWLPIKIARKLRIYNGVWESIKNFEPDVIFMHDAQTCAVFPIVSYIKSHPNVKLYIDSHTDFINSARSWISKNILHGIIYKYCVKHTIPYTQKYYGTLPARVSFYRDFYGTPANKTEFLPMGIDDLSIDFSKRHEIRHEIRQKLNINESDFVIITGGKIDRKKNTHILLRAVSSFNSDDVKVVLFGSISTEMKKEVESLIDNDKRFIYVGWLSTQDTYKYIFASDLACFLGTHSTLWENVVGYGIPAIFKKWKGITHVDKNGNCILVEDPTLDVIVSILQKICFDRSIYEKMNEIASSKRVMESFFYSKIAQYAIEN